MNAEDRDEAAARRNPAGHSAAPSLRDLTRCYQGAVPAVLCTASAAGIPNVTYLSRVHLVDDEHVALSNQFMSKSARNLIENPRASLLLTDDATGTVYRLSLRYERTERRGTIFDRLRTDIDALAALTGMQGVFKLRSADVYRVTAVEWFPIRPATRETDVPLVPVEAHRSDLAAVAEVSTRLARCHDLDTLVTTAIDGLVDVCGFAHVYVMLHDEREKRLVTLASRGYEGAAVGSEVALGDGMVGLAAERRATIRSGNVVHTSIYAGAVARSYAEDGVGPGRALEPPALPMTDSRLATPMVALGRLVGVIVAESVRSAAYDDADETAMSIVAAQLAAAIEHFRTDEEEDDSPSPSPPRAAPAGEQLVVRFFDVDGSVFFGNDYIIKGVAGRLLWALARAHAETGRTEFTNKEMRLDRSLGLPEYRDNFESRLILLKRRLEEQPAGVRIEKTGRGRFRFVVDTTLIIRA